jgi:hypothetical protein
MPDTPENTLAPFIHAAKSQGASDDFLANLLSRAGWPSSDVYLSLGRYWEQSTGLPIPRRTGSGENSRDAFLYLLAFATLCTWACSLGSMLFHFIDHWLPDPVSNAYTSLRSLVSWQMAGVAVAFPIFLLTTRAIVKEAEGHAERLQSTVICDLICALGFFLQGELTSRFVLKAAVVMVICAGIFAYYLGSLRKGENRVRSFRFAIAASFIVCASLATGLTLTGSPAAQRLISADAKRQANLRTLAGGIKNWYNIRHQMPATLADLKTQGFTTVDPANGRLYEYRLQHDTSYQLCANFNARNQSEPGSPEWHHSGGHFCYTLDAAQQVPW